MVARPPDVDRGAPAGAACAQRLHRSSDVRSAFTAHRSGTELLVVHGRRRSDAGPPRATVVAGKKVGNAVQRNRVKRRLREVVAQGELPVGFDLVVVGRPGAVGAPFSALVHDLHTAVTNLVRRA